VSQHGHAAQGEREKEQREQEARATWHEEIVTREERGRSGDQLIVQKLTVDS
jgi:hypothetical protein